MIGNDLKIVAEGLKIISRGTFQVDGKVKGDVIRNEVVIGELRQITSTVANNLAT